MVVNEYEDVVGVISIEDILERIIGKKLLMSLISTMIYVLSLN